MRAWRITSRKFAHAAFTGEGAARSPGRWNQSGVPVVYLAGSIATGILEILVHVNKRDFLAAFVSIEIEVPDGHIETLQHLPPDWQQLPEPYPASTQRLGSDWAQSQRSLALKVPSAVVPSEFNLLLNPRHPAISLVQFGEPQELWLDPRLLGVSQVTGRGSQVAGRGSRV
jgi:RES domain-containing protein